MSNSLQEVGGTGARPAAPGLDTFPEVLLLRIVFFNTFETILNLLKTCKRCMDFFCSTEVDHMLFRPIAFATVPNIIFQRTA